MQRKFASSSSIAVVKQCSQHLLRSETATTTSSLGRLVLLAGRYIARCFYRTFGIPFQHNANVNGDRQNNQEFHQRGTDRNQISISVIPTTGTFWSQGKVLVIGGQPSITHMTPVVA
ncbi:hypothetical protein HN011_002895 [Eciton burchellii]|nr:hypothetical protein HN011_002895 [Eciton burchellii]